MNSFRRSCWYLLYPISPVLAGATAIPFSENFLSTILRPLKKLYPVAAPRIFSPLFPIL